MGILLPLIHLLFELLGLFFIDEAQACHYIFQLERMKESPILVVLKGVINFLVPDDSSVRRGYIDELYPERVADQIVGEHGSPLKACVGPFLSIRIRDVELGYCYGMDLVVLLWDCTLDRLLVLVREN